MSKKKGWIVGPYVVHRLEMLKSAAWRAIRSGVARQVLDRIEIEHMNHAGKDNGRLIITYDNFVAHGIRRKSVGPGVRLLKATGVLLVTQQGRRRAGYHIPTMYALTYLPIDGAAPTDEWRNYLPNTPQRNLSDFAAASKKARKPRKILKTPGAKTPLGAGGNIAPSSGGENAPAHAGNSGGNIAPPIYKSTHLPASEEKLVEEMKKSESLEACTEAPAAPTENDDLDLPNCLRRGHRDCWVKE